jgi:PTS system nitrogen regulatory IIA component
MASQRVAVADLLPRGAVSADLAAATRWEAIEGLCAQLVPTQTDLDLDDVRRTVKEREELMGTAIGVGVAVPHGRCKHLSHPLVAFGLSRQGLEWDAPDGQPVHFVFLLLTPAQGADMQIRLLAAIATLMADVRVREELKGLRTAAELHARLHAALGNWTPGEPPVPARSPAP